VEPDRRALASGAEVLRCNLVMVIRASRAAGVRLVSLVVAPVLAADVSRVLVRTRVWCRATHVELRRVLVTPAVYSPAGAARVDGLLRSRRAEHVARRRDPRGER